MVRADGRGGNSCSAGKQQHLGVGAKLGFELSDTKIVFPLRACGYGCRRGEDEYVERTVRQHQAVEDDVEDPTDNGPNFFFLS